MGDIVAMLGHGFMQRALAGGIAIGIVASFLGAFVVQRRLGYLAGGLSHAAFGGVALGILLGVAPLAVALPFTIAIAVAIHAVQDRSPISSDSAIGVFFSVSMALGIVFLALTPRYSADAFAFLFGSILSVSAWDVAAAWALLIASVASMPLWGRWAMATFDAELARADGHPTRRHDLLLFVFLAVVIVISIKIVGMVLAGAFTVIPAAAARLGCVRFSSMTMLSVAIGVASVVLGLCGSVAFNLPSGATIILVQAVIFLVMLAMRPRGT